MPGTYALFANLLEYPTAALSKYVDECLAAAATGSSAVVDVSSLLGRFRAHVERVGAATLEERYTAAFDLDPACTLSVGHHLFGETRHRSVFMSRLSALYAQAGFSARSAELPDHLPTMLRFVDGLTAADASRLALLEDAIAPAVGALAATLERRGDPYAFALRALEAEVATELSDASVKSGGATR